MKTKHVIFFWLLTMPIVVLGALFKIQHWEGASLLLTAGMLLQALAYILLLWKLLTHPKLREFMNK